MREKILNLLEKNARIDIHDMAVMLGVAEHEVANEIADMEKEHIIRICISSKIMVQLTSLSVSHF